MPIGNKTYYYENYVTVGIWSKKSGTWSKVSDYVVYTYGGAYLNSGGNRTYSASVVDANFNLGSGVTDWGLTIEAADYGTATLTAFNNLKYSISGSSGDTSALASGAVTTVTVRPV